MIPLDQVRFPKTVEEVLNIAGWYHCRALSDTEMEDWLVIKWQDKWPDIRGYCHIFPAAFRILREFGGLFIEQDQPGVTCYRESVLLDPTKAWVVGSSWIRDEWLLERSLFPVGVTGEQQEIIIAISHEGKTYLLLDGFGIRLAGETFDQALVNLISGYAPTKIEILDYERKIDEVKQVVSALRTL